MRIKLKSKIFTAIFWVQLLIAIQSKNMMNLVNFNQLAIVVN